MDGAAVRDPVYALLHEMAHATGVKSEEEANQFAEALLADPNLKDEWEKIRKDYPAAGKIYGETNIYGLRFKSRKDY